MSDKGDACNLVDETAVRAILAQKMVSTFFQPVVSITAKAVVGFEAFSRPAGEDCSVDTRMLFHAGLDPKIMVSVDNLCREKAIEQFKPFHDGHAGLLLFLNANPETVPYLDKDRLRLPQLLKEAGVAPESVVLECPVLEPPHIEKMLQVVEVFKGLGIRFGVDNCGVSDSFSVVINRLEPDFVKVNRTFFGEAECADYSARVLETVQADAARVGATVIGQGVETEKESVQLLASGVCLQQGYYYTKDAEGASGDSAASLLNKISEANAKYKQLKKAQINGRKERFSELFQNVNFACSRFANMSVRDFEDGCKVLMRKSDDIVSAFILDQHGVQVTNRVYRSNGSSAPKSSAVTGAVRGSDHSAEDYAIYIDMGYQQFVTRPAASHFIEGMSVLICKPFFNTLGDRFVACFEMKHLG